MLDPQHKKKVSEYTKVFSKNKPFPNIVIDRFFDEKQLRQIRDALRNEQFRPKDADLFTFYQTDDLAYTKNAALKKFRTYLLSEEFMHYIEQLTHTRLKRKQISIHATLYTDTKYLLCHDDRLNRRRLALLVYLSDLMEKDGGALVLYDSKHNRPHVIKQKIIPKFNRFAMFNIDKRSFHEVKEVVSRKPRLAIGWWYYD